MQCIKQTRLQTSHYISAEVQFSILAKDTSHTFTCRHLEAKVQTTDLPTGRQQLYLVDHSRGFSINHRVGSSIHGISTCRSVFGQHTDYWVAPNRQVITLHVADTWVWKRNTLLQYLLKPCHRKEKMSLSFCFGNLCCHWQQHTNV